MPPLKLSQCILDYHSSTFLTEKKNWSTISFSTEKLTQSKCQVSLAVKYRFPLPNIIEISYANISGEHLQDHWSSGFIF